MSIYPLEWRHIDAIPSKSYTCGYCANPLASQMGWTGLVGGTGAPAAFIYVCHHCNRPTFIDVDGKQYPGATFGDPVRDVQDISVSELYDEARTATGAGCYTAAVLCCRKLLMHIAVSKGAKPGATFVDYVQYLTDNHYVPPDAKGWVDHIRLKANEANHEIVIMKRNDAEELISFIEMLLKVIFEFPASINKKISGTSQNP